MRTPEEQRKRLEARWKNQRRNWLLGQGEWPLPFSTEPPTEADVLADWTRFDRWLAQWREVSHASRGVVRYEIRIWSRVGEQQIPCAWQFDAPDAVAAELGQASRWSQAKRRFDELATWASSESWRMELSRHFDVLADFSDAEFERLCTVVMWLREQPRSNLYPRQLPVPGIDSKWVESRRAVVACWVAVLRGIPATGDFFGITGLRGAPDRLRMRLLDKQLSAVWRAIGY